MSPRSTYAGIVRPWSWICAAVALTSVWLNALALSRLAGGGRRVLMAAELYILCSTGLLTGLGRIRALSRLNMATAAITLVVGAGPVLVAQAFGCWSAGELSRCKSRRRNSYARAVGAFRGPKERGSTGLVGDMVRFGARARWAPRGTHVSARDSVPHRSPRGTQAAGYYSVPKASRPRVTV